MKTFTKWFGVLGSIALSGQAAACGVCVEDRVAATYDHALVRRAATEHRSMVFVALDGPDASRVRDRIASTAANLTAVQRGSLRYAESPAAFSFVLATRGAKPDATVAAFRKATAGMQVSMTIVRLMQDGRLVEPPPLRSDSGTAL